LEIGIGSPLDDSTAELGLHVRITEVHDGQGDPRIAPRVPRLERAFAGAHEDAVAVRPTQTGVLKGDPSGMRVARWAKFGRSSRCLTSADRG